MFDEYKQEMDSSGPDPVLHCILISNSLPHNSKVTHNLNDKYDGFTMDSVIREMREVIFAAERRATNCVTERGMQHNIRMSLITTKRGEAEYSRLVDEVRSQEIV